MNQRSQRICEPPGPWGGVPGNRGPFSRTAANVPYPCDMPPMPGADSYGNPCSPVTGIDARYFLTNGRAELTNEVPSTEVPVLFAPAPLSQSDGWVVVANRLVPSGFHGRYARIRTHLESSVEWSNAVQWAIRTGNGSMMIEEPWRGEINDANWVNLKDKSNPGRDFQLVARVHPDYFWDPAGAVPPGPTPITSLVVGVAWFELIAIADSAPCEPQGPSPVPH